MRRLVITEPVAASATWCKRLSAFGAILVIVAIGASRLRFIEPAGAVASLGVGLVVVLLGLLLAPVAAVVIWRTGHRGIGAVLFGSLLACLVIAYPAYLGFRAARLPAISDISTDYDQPLAFARTPTALASRHSLTRDPPPASQLPVQTAAYPDVRALTLDGTPAVVEQAALRLVRKRRWPVLDIGRPAGQPAAGHIDAVARSLIMGFPQDVVIRIVAAGAGQTRVDMRSASRWGQRDLGANASRIEAFLSDLEDAVDEE